MRQRHLRDAQWCYLHASEGYFARLADQCEPDDYIPGDRARFKAAREARDWLHYFALARKAALYHNPPPTAPAEGDPPPLVQRILRESRKVQPGRPGEDEWAPVSPERAQKLFRDVAARLFGEGRP